MTAGRLRVMTRRPSPSDTRIDSSMAPSP
jgi:hypothetical protein